MSYKFIGENIPELELMPTKERRRMYLKAAGKSYLYASTWLGLLLFFGLSYIGTQYSVPIADKLSELLATPKRGEMMVSIGLSTLALFILYRFQIDVVKAIIRKNTKSQQGVPGYDPQAAAMHPLPHTAHLSSTARGSSPER